MRIPSTTQRLAYTAANAAAIRPARLPATSRATRPTTTTVPVPAALATSLCANQLVPPKNDDTASRSEKRGG